MILTEEQRQELDGPNPVRVVDPQTKREYVLLQLEFYERLRPFLDKEVAPALDSGVPPGIQRSKAAFLRDLPQLMANKKHDGWWAAYHGEERIGMARTGQQLLQEIQRQRIPRDEYYLGVIRPHEAEPEEIEPIHFHHFEDLDGES